MVRLFIEDSSNSEKRLKMSGPPIDFMVALIQDKLEHSCQLLKSSSGKF
jgi:hypothetical protein